MTPCTLCDLPADERNVSDDAGNVFCCRGCREVHNSLDDVESLEDVESISETTPIPDDASLPEDGETAYLAVDGMHCSTCEVFLESVARENEAIYDAEASYAAEAIKLVYDPDETEPDELTAVVSGLGYSARKRDESSSAETDAVSRLLVGGLFGMMAMVWYALFLYPTYFGYDPIVESSTFGSAYLYAQLAVMTGIVLLYTGRPLLRGAFVSLRAGHPNVDLLVSIAAVSAYIYSTATLLQGGSDLYYDVTIVVVMAVSIGNYYEGRIKQRTAGLLADLTELQVDEATLQDGTAVPVDDIDPGDRVLVSPGERVPVDGTVCEGEAAVDESLVTGESLPETRTPGDEVRGGTVVTDSPLVVEAGPEAESTLDRVVDLLWDIQAARPGAQRVADRVATVFVPLVLGLATMVTVASLALGTTVQASLLRGLTVLIVSCPCALGLATPLAVAAGLRSAADRGVVVATPALFEHSGDIDTLVLDKTGTITDGEMSVRGTAAVDGDTDTLLARAAAVEQFADHPVADAIVDAHTGSGEGTTPAGSVDVSSVETTTRGISGVVDGETVRVGHPDLFDEDEWAVPTEVTAHIESVHESGDIPVVVGRAGAASGVIAVGDSPRETWDSVVASVGSDCQVVVLTGDEGPAADRLRDHPAVDEVFAGVPPDGKAATVDRLAATGTVAMVGDGSNDAPALAAADVGIALESGTKLATDAADAIVLAGDLSRVPTVFDVAEQTNTRIRQNLAWAFLYNAIAIPLAVTTLLNPLFAAVAMATSSLLVVANSSRTHPEKTGDRATSTASPDEQTADAGPPATTSGLDTVGSD